MSKFFAKLKGDKSETSHLSSQAGQTTLSSNNPYRNIQPPAYEPPPGPPPNRDIKTVKNDQESSIGIDNPPPYHDWTSIEDTALLPPPPPITSDYSSTSNADSNEADAAHAWCARNLVYIPQMPNSHLVEAIQAGQHDLDPPPNFTGSVIKLSPATAPSSFKTNAFGAVPIAVYRISTLNHALSSSSTHANPQHHPEHQQPSKPPSKFSRLLNKSPAPPSSSSSSSTFPHSLFNAFSSSQDRDQTFLSRLPLYFAQVSNPLLASPASRAPVTIFLSLTPTSFASPTSTIALGFAAKPYPPNRQPGWHRASLAIHSDDGNRYVNDSWGGRPFTQPIGVGETVGLAVVIYPEACPSTQTAHLQSEREVLSALPKCRTRIYFTRNGAVAGDWEIDEQRDAERDEGVAGLMGEVDLYAAVGMFGGGECEVKFWEEGRGFVVPPDSG